MQIEFIGCTSAGKSTRIYEVRKSYAATGIETLLGDEFVLQLVKLDWVRGYLLRRLLVDFFALLACLSILPSASGFLWLAAKRIIALPGSVGWFEKLNMARNVVRNVGVHRLVERFASGQQVVIIDEGTVQTAHYLFVSVAAEVDLEQLQRFSQLVPLPDALVFVEESQEILIARTLRRGHKRIPSGSQPLAKLFIERAVQTFALLTSVARIQSKLVRVDARQRQPIHHVITALISGRESNSFTHPNVSTNQRSLLSLEE